MGTPNLSTVINHATITGITNFNAYCAEIKTGEYQSEIDRLREAVKKGDMVRAQIIKNGLPAVMPHGEFALRKNHQPPIVYSQLIALDIDKLHAQSIDPGALLSRLQQDTLVAGAHLSCGGDGMVIWVHHTGNEQDHENTVEQIADRFEERYTLKVDRRASKAINSIRYISYDPDLHYNPDPESFEPLDHNVYSKIMEELSFTLNKLPLIEGNRNNFLFQLACNCSRVGVDKIDLISFALSRWKTHDFDAQEITSTVDSAYSQPRSSKNMPGKVINKKRIKKDPLTVLLETEEYLRKKIKEDITDQEPIFLSGKTPIVFPNSIVVIQGKHGSHKSRVAGSFSSAAIQAKECSSKPLDLSVTNEELHLIYVDTERNLKTQLPMAIQRILEAACIPKDINHKNFTYTSMVEISREQRFDTLQEYVENIRDKVGQDKHIILVIDVITDLVRTFNDPAEAMALCDYLNGLINKENCTVIAVVHENPAGSNDKARGHLGTELTNKASTVLQVSKFHNLKGHVAVTIIKSRNTELPDPIIAEFDEATGGLRAVDPVRFEELRTGKETKSTLSNVIGYLGIHLSTPMPRKDLIVALCGTFQCGERTIESKFKEIFDQNMVINTPLGPKILEKESRPDGLYYKLSDPEPPTASANPI